MGSQYKAYSTETKVLRTTFRCHTKSRTKLIQLGSTVPLRKNREEGDKQNSVWEPVKGDFEQ